MAKIYTFRVILDTEEDVFRDIVISADDLFLNLHNEIKKAFQFDGSEMASFYMSDDEWIKGQEVTLMKMDFDDGSSSVEMNSTPIDEFIRNHADKMVYVFDFMLMWCFFVELVNISEIKPLKQVPYCEKSVGESPYQYGKKLEPKSEDDKHLLSNKKIVTADDLLKGFDDIIDPMDEFDELPDDF